MEYFYFKTGKFFFESTMVHLVFGKFAEVTLTVVCTTIPCRACSSLSSLFFNISFIYFAVLTQLQHVRSLIFVVAYGIFSCSMWDLVLWPGIKLRTPALEVQSLSHWTTRKVPDLLLSLRLNWSFYFFSFMGYAFVVMSKNSLPNPKSWRSSPNTRATNSYPPVVFPTLGSVDKASAVLFRSVPCVCAPSASQSGTRVKVYTMNQFSRTLVQGEIRDCVTWGWAWKSIQVHWVAFPRSLLSVRAQQPPPFLPLWLKGRASACTLCYNRSYNRFWGPLASGGELGWGEPLRRTLVGWELGALSCPHPDPSKRAHCWLDLLPSQKNLDSWLPQFLLVIIETHQTISVRPLWMVLPFVKGLISWPKTLGLSSSGERGRPFYFFSKGLDSPIHLRKVLWITQKQQSLDSPIPCLWSPRKDRMHRTTCSHSTIDHRATAALWSSLH